MGNPPFPTDNRNRVAIVLVASATALLVGAAVGDWWAVIGGGEPRSYQAGRLVCVALAILTGISIFRPRQRTALVFFAAVAAVFVPPLLVVHTATIDSTRVTAAVEQTSQAERLIASLVMTEFNPQVAWMEEREIRVAPTISNDFTLIEGLESVSYFLRAGWWFCLIAGVLLLVAVWFWDTPGARRWIQRYGFVTGALVGVVLLRCLGPLALAADALQKARYEEARGNHTAALQHYETARRWDPRLDYAISYHNELGRLYGRIGRTDRPDYSVMVADLLAEGGRVQRSRSLFEVRADGAEYANLIADVPVAVRAPENRRSAVEIDRVGRDSNPSLRSRYAHHLLLGGAEEYNSGRFRSAVDLWQKAYREEPANLEIHYVLGVGFSKLGDYREASRWWRNLAIANEGVGLFRFNLVTSLQYRKMITARAFAGLAWCHFRLGDMDAALRYDSISKQQAPSGLEQP